VKKVDKFLLKSFIGPLIFTFFIVLIILILQFLWMYVDELAGKGLDFKMLSELTLLILHLLLFLLLFLLEFFWLP
jgi:lipopolysaccharide export system permease protein